MRPQPPNSTFTSWAVGPAGLVGSIGWSLEETDGDVVIARSTAGIVETNPGRYVATRTTPSTEGEYTIVWDTGGSVPQYAYDDLEIDTNAALSAWSGYVTAAQIRTWSKVDFDDLGYDAPTGDDEDPLDVLIRRSEADLRATCDLNLADLTGDDWRVPFVEEVLQALVEYRVGAYQGDVAETGADYDMIQSFGAGGYNETRRSINAGQNALHPVPRIARLMAAINGTLGSQGKDVPSVGVFYEPDWDVGKEILALPSRLYGPFGPLYDPWA